MDVHQATRRQASRVTFGARSHIAPGPTTWAAMILREQGMPSEEIRAVLGASDPGLVHRYLELHLERMEERLDEHRSNLATIERLLTEGRTR